MKRLALLLLLAIPCFAAWPNGYSYRSAITIDHTKVPNTDQANFPVLISGAYADLKYVANGGRVQSASGFDLIFTSDAYGANKLAWEVESYNPATGAIVAWVKVPFLSHTTNTVIYLFYGNSSVTTDQSNRAGTWDTDYKGIWHLPNGTALSVNDSTSNGNNASIIGQTAVTGIIDGAAHSSGATSSASFVPSSTTLTGPSALTVSLWVKTTIAQPGQGDSGVAFSKHGGGTNGEWYLTVGGASATANQVDFTVINANSSRVNLVGNLASNYTDGVWHYLVGTYNGSAMKVYFDGKLVGTANQTGAVKSYSPAPLGFGSLQPGNHSFTGDMDEARFSTTARSADWIAAEYANQNSPSTFYSIGSAEMFTSASAGAGVLNAPLIY